MLSGEGNQNGKKTTCLISKTTTLHVQHTFFVHFFAVVLHDHNVKLPETSRNFLVTRFMEKMAYLLLFNFFHSLIFTFVAARISHFLTAAKKFSCCSSNKYLLIFRYSSPSLFFSLKFAGLSPTLFFLYIPNLWT